MKHIVLIGLLLLLGSQSHATFTKLFREGDSAIHFAETCAMVVESTDVWVPSGKSCGDDAAIRNDREEFINPEDGNVAVVGSMISSDKGSTITLSQGNEHELSILVDEKAVLRFTDPGGVAEAVDAAYWHDEHWVVEYLGKSVVVSGKKIGPQYDGVFSTDSLKESPSISSVAAEKSVSPTMESSSDQPSMPLPIGSAVRRPYTTRDGVTGA